MTTRDVLVERVRAFMDGSLVGRPPEPFGGLVLALHAHQAASDPALAALASPAPTTWADVPAVPVDLYKRLRIGTVREERAPVCFLTSGTTGGGRGCHALLDTRLYNHGALAWALRCVPDLPADVVALLDDPDRAPDSSLSHMVALFPRGAGHASWHVRDGVLDRDGLHARLGATHGPVFLAATAFALAEWVVGDVLPLPPGSVVMVTGGFKGRKVELDDLALYAAVRTRLGCARIVVEYGMTELSSQLWGIPGEALRPPPWLRAVAVDPATGEALPPGTPGQLRFYDLANVDSSVGVETLDRGLVHGDGAVELLGRLDGADARGCSLRIEEAWLRGSDG